MGNPATDPLRRGNAFHADVQTAFLASLLGAEARPERPLTLSRSRNGRVDLLVLPSGDEVTAAVVEIKSTDWDALAEHRLRPNLRSHIRQLQRYLDVYIDASARGPAGQHPASGTASAASCCTHAVPTTQLEPLVEQLADADVPSHRTWSGHTPLTCGGPDSPRRRPAGCLT